MEAEASTEGGASGPICSGERTGMSGMSTLSTTPPTSIRDSSAVALISNGILLSMMDGFVKVELPIGPFPEFVRKWEEI